MDPQTTRIYLERMPTYTDYMQALKAIRIALSTLKATQENPDKDQLFRLIDRIVAYKRFEELALNKTPCRTIRDLIAFGYAPRQPNVNNKDLPEEAREIISLVPSYCARL